MLAQWRDLYYDRKSMLFLAETPPAGWQETLWIATIQIRRRRDNNRASYYVYVQGGAKETHPLPSEVQAFPNFWS